MIHTFPIEWIKYKNSPGWKDKVTTANSGIFSLSGPNKGYLPWLNISKLLCRLSGILTQIVERGNYI